MLHSARVEPLTLATGVMPSSTSDRALRPPQYLKYYQNPIPPLPFFVQPRNLTSPNPHTLLGQASIVERGPNAKCMGLRFLHLFNTLTISLRDCMVLYAITIKLSVKWGKVNSMHLYESSKKKIQSHHFQVFPGM